MFESRRHRLLSRLRFAWRMARAALCALAIICVSLVIGIVGYHYLGHLGWVDSLLNASMILGGMGPVDTLTNTGGKLFASCYALFSGLVLITLMGIVLAPVAHRMLHTFHLDESDLRQPPDQPHP